MPHSHEEGEKLILRLSKGEEIISSLLNFCRSQNIESGWVTGLGALLEVDFANYNLKNKTYSKKHIEGSLELLNLTGNIGLLEGKPVAHLHATISDENFNAFGGHLDRAIVAATCEIVFDIFEHPINRKFDEEIGLNLITSN